MKKKNMQKMQKVRKNKRYLKKPKIEKGYIKKSKKSKDQKIFKQAGAELGQAQLKLRLDFN